MHFQLLLKHTDSRRPVLSQGLSLTSVLREPLPVSPVKPTHLYDLNGDLNDLSSQRWAMVAPHGPRGNRLLERVAQLHRLRAEQQHIRPEELHVFRVQPGMTAVQAEEFRRELLKLPNEEQPRYLLVLGDADEVSFEFQQHLAVDRFVGRLAFPQEEDFEAYADKVVKAEQGEARAARARTLFYTSHDGTVATRHGHELLISRSLQLCQQSSQRGSFPTSEVRELSSRQDTSSDQLLEGVADFLPSVLLTLSHGDAGPAGGWSSSVEQRRHQGSLVLGTHQVLTVDDVARRSFLPGGMWIYFACFSAGTPVCSTYTPWLKRLRDAGEGDQALKAILALAPMDMRPFVAALPQAALANPNGPLAVIGHVDLAWSCAYHEVDGTNHAMRFTNVLGDLVRRRRAGVGLYSLTSAIASVDARLAMLYQQDAVAFSEGQKPPQEVFDRAHLWMARHDLSAYVLLGDPAVRLPLTDSRR